MGTFRGFRPGLLVTACRRLDYPADWNCGWCRLTGGPPLLVLPLEVGERFTLHYYHSVENAPIWEEHSLDRARPNLHRRRTLPEVRGRHGPHARRGTMVQRGPYEAIENMHLPTGDFILRVGSPGVDHTVIWRRYPDQPLAPWPPTRPFDSRPGR